MLIQRVNCHDLEYCHYVVKCVEMRLVFESLHHLCYHSCWQLFGYVNHLKVLNQVLLLLALDYLFSNINYVIVYASMLVLSSLCRDLLGTQIAIKANNWIIGHWRGGTSLLILRFILVKSRSSSSAGLVNIPHLFIILFEASTAILIHLLVYSSWDILVVLVVVRHWVGLSTAPSFGQSAPSIVVEVIT